MIAELYDNDTPITVKNFLDLIGKKFYDGLNFHRVIPGFVCQGGCPNGVGNGGPGYTIQCETNAPKQFHDKGVLSMAHVAKILEALNSLFVITETIHNILTVIIPVSEKL